MRIDEYPETDLLSQLDKLVVETIANGTNSVSVESLFNTIYEIVNNNFYNKGTDVIPISSGGTGNTNGLTRGLIDANNIEWTSNISSANSSPDSILCVKGNDINSINDASLREWFGHPKLLFHGTCKPGGTINVKGYRKYSVFLFRPEDTGTIGVMINPGINYDENPYITGIAANVWTGNGNTDGGFWRVSFSISTRGDGLILNGCPWANAKNTGTWNSHGIQDIWGVI